MAACKAAAPGQLCRNKAEIKPWRREQPRSRCFWIVEKRRIGWDSLNIRIPCLPRFGKRKFCPLEWISESPPNRGLQPGKTSLPQEAAGLATQSRVANARKTSFLENSSGASWESIFARLKAGSRGLSRRGWSKIASGRNEKARVLILLPFVCLTAAEPGCYCLGPSILEILGVSAQHL
jgi:hypothetical protein